MKLKFILVLGLLSFWSSYAQFDFIVNNIVDETYAPINVRSIQTGDIDGDGDMDVVSASYVDDKIAWYEYNSGNGEFLPRRIITSNTSGASAVFPVDVDGDGDLDVVTGAAQSDEVAWYENTDGLGNFGPANIISSLTDGIESVFAVDLDGDGDMDVLSASQYDDKIAWYENTNGQGLFGPQMIINTENDYPHFVYAVDIDGDGDKDVLSASSHFGDSVVAWYENENGQGSFGARQIISAEGNGIQQVYAADLDGDGDLDVVSASDSFNGVRWHENMDGQGNFAFEQVITTNFMGASSIFPIDLDNDGDVDILATYENNIVALHENVDGLGNFSEEQIISEDSSESNFIFASDINNDNKLDIILASQWADQISWLRSINGLGSFKKEKLIAARPDFPIDHKVFDLDGDGDLDIIGTSFDDNKIYWYENLNGYGTFGGQRIISKLADGPWSVDVGDIDGDGDADVVSTSIVDDVTAWHENLNNQLDFGPPQIIDATDENPSSALLVDIDKDGDLDVIRTLTFEIDWFENLDGQGTFSGAHVITNQVISPQAISVVDVDGDGDPDVVSGSANDNKAAWFENVGSGSFGPQHIIFIGDNSVDSIDAADMDGDGDIDVVSSTGWGSIFLHRNADGNGNFGTEEIIDSNAGIVRPVHVQDLDNDGDMDILVSDEQFAVLYAYENMDGLGNFSSRIFLDQQGNYGGLGLATGDVDNDGDMDIVTHYTAQDGVTWYENTLILGMMQTKHLSIVLFPVPAEDILKIMNLNDPQEISLYSILGRHVTTVYDQNELDISSISPGVYFITVRDAKGDIGVARFIKE
jgi:FG-GAP-like repeat/Secretion system C-terminal sorting domain